MKFTKKEIADMLGKDKRTITFWADIGLVEATNRDHIKRGVARKFDEYNLIEFFLIDVLSSSGVGLEYIKRLMSHFRVSKSNGSLSCHDFMFRTHPIAMTYKKGFKEVTIHFGEAMYFAVSKLRETKIWRDFYAAIKSA